METVVNVHSQAIDSAYGYFDEYTIDTASKSVAGYREFFREVKKTQPALFEKILLEAGGDWGRVPNVWSAFEEKYAKVWFEFGELCVLLEEWYKPLKAWKNKGKMMDYPKELNEVIKVFTDNEFKKLVRKAFTPLGIPHLESYEGFLKYIPTMRKWVHELELDKALV